MFQFKNLKQIHLEITTRCQASCPMCSRNFHGGLENPNLKLSEWTIEEFCKIFDNELLNQISSVYFCGNFGDPIINKDLHLMCSYLKEKNNNISLRIHTNGSARSLDWWKNLATCLPKNHVVIFGIDGLEDTHSRYRVGTDFNQILKNAKSFIDGGGTAEWVFIKFKHNEHQVDEAKKLANLTGFQRFSIKNSSRFLTEDNFSVLNSKGEVDYYLEPPSENQIKFVTKDLIDNVDSWLENTDIDCYVLKTKELYIDAHKILWPCCFLASTPYNYNDPKSIIFDLKNRSLNEYKSLVNRLGGFNKLNLLKNNLKEVVESVEWQTIWNEKWKNKELLVCAKTCGISKTNNFSKPSEQIVERVNLKK
jgi:MoaA/NifB/PqqE/SkfB family radical SAM enzyme